VLFQAADRLDVFDHTPGWPDTIRGALSVRDVAGNHESMLEPPNVHELARQVTACLDRARLPHDGTGART
jgi:thioesterase domain-containing protein